MLLIRTLVRESPIHGLGLFAAEFVAQGTVIWRFTPGFDQRFSTDVVAEMPVVLQEYVRTYAWLSRQSGLYCFAADNGKYVNHSSQPNSISNHLPSEDEVITVALKDIFPGDEITDDYASFDGESKPGRPAFSESPERAPATGDRIFSEQPRERRYRSSVDGASLKSVPVDS